MARGKRGRRSWKGDLLLAGAVLLAAGAGTWLLDLLLRAQAQALAQEQGAPAQPLPPFMGNLPEGEPAPPLHLPALSGDGTFDLESHRGSRPVVLVFASFT